RWQAVEGLISYLLTIHARLYGEKFCRKPRWAMVGEAKDSVSIPVLANGGIFSPEDARKCLRFSGADGVMVGRGAVMRPTLCRDIASEVYGVTVNTRQRLDEELFFRFVDLLEQRFTPERRLGRLKEFVHYFSTSYTFGHQFACAIQTSTTMAQARLRAGEFFTQFKGEQND
ncbi:MAG: tRNA-dihydrouridine synthase, partial [Desulforhopalus sp.]